MDEIQKEKSEGLSWDYLGEAMKERAELSGRTITPMSALMGQMFAVFAKTVIDEVGVEKGEAVIKKAVEDFGQTKGQTDRRKSEGTGAGSLIQELPGSYGPGYHHGEHLRPEHRREGSHPDD